MSNTTKQRKEIEQGLYSRFIHPSPSLKKRWEKRQQREGNGQDVLSKEHNEWLNEGEELKELKANYGKRLTDELWNNQAFSQDVIRTRQIYLENIKLPLTQQDEKCLGQLYQELSDKYHLNLGWLLWLVHCIETGENDPGKLILYLDREKGGKAKHISLDIYFPLPLEIYKEATIYLRMKELETFGDYYSQEQSGGRSKHSRPQKTIAKYNRIIHLRDSPSWVMKTDKEFLEHYTQYNRSELARAKRWRDESKPRKSNQR